MAWADMAWVTVPAHAGTTKLLKHGGRKNATPVNNNSSSGSLKTHRIQDDVPAVDHESINTVSF
jgi:hypothetical protein